MFPGDLHAIRLDVCNKGQVQIQYATAERQGSFLTGYKWVVSGWSTINAGECDNVYHSASDYNGNIYVAFAFTDSTGTWGAADLDLTHDHGEVLRSSEGQHICVALNSFQYTVPAQGLGGSCAKGYFPFLTSVFLEPGQPSDCGTIYGFCANYDFNVQVTTRSRAIQAGPATQKNPGAASTAAKAGSDNSQNKPPSANSNVSLGDVVQAIGKAAAENRQRQETNAHTFATICVPGTLLDEWRNPTHGSKMESFKSRFKGALQRHTQNPDADLTRWWYINNGGYLRYTPDSALNEVVYTNSAGHECNSPGHLEQLALNP
jgi:uncharacterized membrane protein